MIVCVGVCVCVCNVRVEDLSFVDLTNEMCPFYSFILIPYYMHVCVCVCVCVRVY